MKKFLMLLILLIFQFTLPAFAYDYVDAEENILLDETINNLDKESNLIEENTSIKVKYVIRQNLEEEEFKKLVDDESKNIDKDKYIICYLIKNRDNISFYIDYSDSVKNKIDEMDRSFLLDSSRSDMVDLGIDKGMISTVENLNATLDTNADNLKKSNSFPKSIATLIKVSWKILMAVIALLGYIASRKEKKKAKKFKLSKKEKSENADYAKYVNNVSAEDFIRNKDDGKNF